MRAIAIVMSLLALAALFLLVLSIVRLSGEAVRRRSVRKPLSAAAVFTVIFLVTSCGAIIVAPTGE